jgi:hypothetical protein
VASKLLLITDDNEDICVIIGKNSAFNVFICFFVAEQPIISLLLLPYLFGAPTKKIEKTANRKLSGGEDVLGPSSSKAKKPKLEKI